MKVVRIPVVLLTICVLLEVGSCSPANQPSKSSDDRHRKTIELLTLLTDAQWTRTISLQIRQTQYNFFGSNWPKLSVEVGHKISSNLTNFIKKVDNANKTSDNSSNKFTIDHNITISYGRDQSNSNATKNIYSNISTNDKRHKRQAEDGIDTENSASTSTEESISSDNSTAVPVSSTEESTTSTESTTSVSSLMPTDSYGPPPSGIPSYGYGPPPSSIPSTGPWVGEYPPNHTITYPSYGLPSTTPAVWYGAPYTTPAPAYGPPPTTPTVDYGPSIQKIDQIDLTVGKQNHLRDYTHIPDGYSLHPPTVYYPIHPHYPHYSHFKASYPDHLRNFWDLYFTYFIPAHFNGFGRFGLTRGFQ